MDPNPFRRRTFRWPWRSPSAVRRDVDEELQFHLEMRAAELTRDGWPAAQARLEATARFGDLNETRRQCVAEGTRRETRVQRGLMLDEIRGDVIIGCRRLWKTRGVTALALLTLALGIGATTAVFSLVNAALIRPLPYQDAGRLVVYSEGIPGVGRPKMGVSPPDYLDFVRDQRTSDALAIFVNENADVTGDGTVERVTATRVSHTLFPLLGVTPVLGRTFTPDDDRPGADIVVLSHSAWQRIFGGRPDVVGRTLSLDRRPHTVVGVMPRSFEFPVAGLDYNGEPGDLWVPFAMSDEERAGRASYYRNGVIGRLKPGVTLEQARAELPVLIARTMEGYPPQVRSVFSTLKDGGLRGMVSPLRDEIAGPIRLPMLALLAAVVLVLLIACANVANLLLSRAASREHEVAVMAALGAGRGRLVRMLLTESLILGLLAGAVGLGVAWAATVAAPLALPHRLASLGDVTPDLRVLGFTLVISVATALIFGLVPATASARADLQRALGAATRSATGHRGRRHFQHALVVATVGVSVILLVGAGLLVRSFTALLHAEVGSRTDGVLTATVTLPAAAYGSADLVRQFERRLLDRIAALPDVTSAAVSSDLPLAPSDSLAFTAERSPLSEKGVAPAAYGSWPHGDYFRTHGIPLKRGRYFDARDRVGSEPVAIVSESSARKMWPGEDPLGKRLRWGLTDSATPWMTVVGVVGDVKQAGLDAESDLHVYEPWDQVEDERMARPFMRTMRLSVRTGGDPTSLATPLRKAVGGLDAALAVSEVRTMDDRVAAQTAPRQMSAVLMAGFAGAALLMAVVGLYGILAQGAALRRREIGVRLALGAQPRDIVVPLVRLGLVLSAIGLTIGIVSALALGRLLESLLFQTTPHDGVTLVAVPILLGAVAAIASYVPARRASRIAPVEVLRVD